MYRTARRHTRTEPHTMPESRGFSQYSRELIWSELGHMLTRLGTSHWMCLYSCMTPGSPGLGVTVTTLDPATGDRRVSPAQHRRSTHRAVVTELALRHNHNLDMRAHLHRRQMPLVLCLTSTVKNHKDNLTKKKLKTTMGKNLGLEKASGHPAPAASFTSCSRYRTAAAGNFSCSILTLTRPDQMSHGWIVI